MNKAFSIFGNLYPQASIYKMFDLPSKLPSEHLLNNSLSDIESNKTIIKTIIKYLKVHIKNQIKNGANIIQLFDSWAGLANKKFIGEMVYEPNAELVEFIKSFDIPAICFPRETPDYLEFVKEVNPSVIS